MCGILAWASYGAMEDYKPVSQSQVFGSQGGPEEDDREDEEQRDDDEAARPLTSRFPIAARIHVPDAANTAMLVTADMARTEPLRRRLTYQFVLVEKEDE